jgi:cell wall-associated NlpC family hydrolase
VTGQPAPRPRGVQVRERARRLPWPLGAALALCLVTTAAAAHDGTAHSGLARAGTAQAQAAQAQAAHARLARAGTAQSGTAPAGGAQSGTAPAGGAQPGGPRPGTAKDRATRAWAARIRSELAGAPRPGAPGAAGAAAQVGITQTGLQLRGRSRSGSKDVSVAGLNGSSAAPAVAPLQRLLQADLLVVAPASLPAGTAAKIRRLPGVLAAQPVDAARIPVNGLLVATLGVNPSAFRGFAARATARSTGLWQNVADGEIAVSYLLGKQEKLPLGRPVRVAGARTEQLRVGGFGTVGIAGVDAVVSDSVARSLGIPASNAIVISAPHADLSALMSRIKKLLPQHAAVAPLVAQALPAGLAAASPGAAGTSAGLVGSAGAAGGPGVTAADGPGLSPAQAARFLTAALSRVGLPYVWGAAGPRSFDCSGLVQWSLAEAGVAMPRVAVYQARTGPQLPVSQLQPGDLLFYFTDPTAPAYISHVAIYLGNGQMIQAPEPGQNVEVVPAIVGGPGFAGAVRVYPRLAAAVAGSSG